MSRFDHARVMQILADTMELPEGSRASFLDSTCLGEPDLRCEIEDLLECTEPAVRAFNGAFAELACADPEQIGPYTILEPIGEGGMAIVYRAQQNHPVQRVVAVKLIKLGMDTRQFVARFEAERQALALMNHPNVARVFDAGSTESGRPYFVMEYVAGQPILDYCDKQSLGVRQRLELFIVVCEAIEHAHRKGIIHRDIKNSNVLITQVDEKVVPKVIDFGVAKAIQQPLTEQALRTEQGQLIGTPEYMSPEQSERGAVDIDTRSDVYSLGVLLYELISGVQPIPSEVLRGGGYEQIQRIIRDTEPPRPSTRLSTLGHDHGSRVASCRSTPLPTLLRELRSELEWIPLKAMRKDREQRYRSCSELADDIRNYLKGRPLIAGPESRGYRARKFLRRHKAGVAASAAMLLLLLGGIIATTWQAVRATRAEQSSRAALTAAQDANAETRAVNDFLTLDVLWSAEPSVTRGRELSVREALSNAAADVATRFRDRPRIEAAVRSTLAGAYRTLGQLDLALSHSQASVEIVQRLGTAQDPLGLQILNDHALILFDRGDYAGTEAIFRTVLQARRRLLGNRDILTVESIGNLATALLIQRKMDEAEPLVREELNLIDVRPKTDVFRPIPVGRFAAVLWQQGKFDEAEALLRNALAETTKIGGDDHPEALRIQFSLAGLQHKAGKFAEAEERMRSALEAQRRVLGDDHPDTLDSIDLLARLLVDRGKPDEAEPLAREALDGSRRRLVPDDARTIARVNNLARVRLYQGELADAEPLFREALDAARRVRGEESAQTLSISLNLGFVLTRLGKFDQAEPLLRQTLAVQQRVLGNDDIATITSVNNLGGLLFEQKKFADAEAMFRKALDAKQLVLGDAHPETLATLSNLGRAIRAQLRHADAEPVFAELYRLTPTAQVPARQAALFMSHWGPCLVQLGRYDAAEAPLREALDRLTATKQTRGEHMQRVLSALIDVCDHTSRPEEAAQWRARLKELQAATQPATPPK